MGISGGLDVDWESLQGFGLASTVPLVVWVSFSKDFLSTCPWEAFWDSLDVKLTPFELLGSPREGIPYSEVYFLPSKGLYLERAFEISPLLSRRESCDRLDISAAGETASLSMKRLGFAFRITHLGHFVGGPRPIILPLAWGTYSPKIL